MLFEMVIGIKMSQFTQMEQAQSSEYFGQSFFEAFKYFSVGFDNLKKNV